MGNLRVVWGVGLAVLVGGCGGSAQTKWTGGITLSASGSWSVTADDGSTDVGNETLDAHCTNNGDGVGEFTATLSLHRVGTSPDGKTVTWDVGGSTDQPLTPDNTHCVLGISDGRGDWGASFEVMSFDVSGTIVAEGVSMAANGDVTTYDPALVTGSADGQFSQPQSGSKPAAVVGMYSFNSGDVVGGSPSMVVTTLNNGHGIPVTVSWSYAPLN